MTETTDGHAALAAVLDQLPLDRAVVMLSDMRPRLNRASVDLLERRIAERMQIGYRTDPFTLSSYLEGDAIKPWAYTQLLARKFREAVQLESRFQAWSLPAQVGKTTWLRRGLLWAMDRQPDAQNLYMSHHNDLARESALWLRDMARVHSDELRFDLKPDVQRQDRWMTTQGGGLFATHVGGGSGFSVSAGGVCVVDDPLRNWQAAHSKVEREHVWNEIRAVARLRLAEGAAFIMAHTRWHLLDPTGMLMQLSDELGIEVEFVRLPMLCDSADDPLGRAIGEPLEPERYSLDECRARAVFLGSYLTAAMEQQSPVPEEGGELKREWWRLTTNTITVADQWLTSWDMKLKDKESGDYVVGQCWARTGGDFWCVDQLRGQYSLRQTKIAIALMHHRHQHVGKHVIENTGNGPEVMAELRKADPTFVLDDDAASKVGVADHERAAVQELIRRGMSGLVAENVKGDKLTRARTHLSPKLEAGNVHLVESSWANALIDEAAGFPPTSRSGHDDMVDAATQALKHLGRSEARTLSAPSMPVVTPSPSARSVGRILT
jgi:phage terminase large subunit-like protein